MTANASADDSLWASEQQLWDEVRGHAHHNALIEQAKGMLMFAYGIDADEAFDVLRSQSQNHNVKLRLIAEQVVKDLVELSRTSTLARRVNDLDGVMQNAHERISHSAARQLNGESKTGVPHEGLEAVLLRVSRWRPSWWAEPKWAELVLRPPRRGRDSRGHVDEQSVPSQ